MLQRYNKKNETTKAISLKYTNIINNTIQINAINKHPILIPTYSFLCVHFKLTIYIFN